MRDLHLHLLIPVAGMLSTVVACQSDLDVHKGSSDDDPDMDHDGFVGSGGMNVDDDPTSNGGSPSNPTSDGGAPSNSDGAGGSKSALGGSSGIPHTGDCATTDEVSPLCVATNYCTAYHACDPDDFVDSWESVELCIETEAEGLRGYLEPEGYDESDPDVKACLDAYKKYYLCVQKVIISSCDVWSEDYEPEPGSPGYECTLAYAEIDELCSYID